VTFINYQNINEVPIYRFPVVNFDHPQIKMIVEAYTKRGMGIGINYGKNLEKN